MILMNSSRDIRHTKVCDWEKTTQLSYLWSQSDIVFEVRQASLGNSHSTHREKHTIFFTRYLVIIAFHIILDYQLGNSKLWLLPVTPFPIH